MNHIIIDHDEFNTTKFGFSIVAVIFSVLFLLAIFWFGILLSVLTITIIFLKVGIEIDPINRNYRYFQSFFGVKSGKWKSLENFKALIILKKTMKSERLSPRMVNTIDHKSLTYEVNLASENHRNKFALKKFKESEAAKNLAETIATRLNFPIESYDPVLSEKTRMRRANRQR